MPKARRRQHQDSARPHATKTPSPAAEPTPAHSPGPAESGPAPQILFLQQTLGNRVVTGLLHGRPAAQRQGAPPATPAQQTFDYPGHLLRAGGRGDAVRQAQTLLNRHGAGLDPDGIFGPLTHQAVVTFQQGNGLAVDGIVGPLTWAALNQQRPGGDHAQPPTEKPPPSPPGGLSQADLNILAGALTAAGAVLLADHPAAGAPALPGIQAAVELLTAGQPPTAIPEGPGPAATETGVQMMVMRQMPKPLPPAQPDPMAGLKQSFDRLLDFVIFDMGQQSYSGPRGVPGDPVLSQALSLDYLHKLLAPILAQPWPQNPGPNHAAARAELTQFLRRLVAMRAFYNSLLPQPQFLPPGAGPEAGPAAMPAQHRPADPRRAQLAATGLADLGKVKANETESDGRRVGWRHLLEIFDKAWPTHEQDQVHDFKIERKHTVPIGVHGQPGQTKPGDWMPSWCGVGATYWAKRVNTAFPDWKQGVGVHGKLTRRGFDELPQVGDLVTSTNQGHHGIITWVDPDASPPTKRSEWDKIAIKTVESNIGGEIVETPGHHATLSYWNVGVYDTFNPK